MHAAEADFTAYLETKGWLNTPGPYAPGVAGHSQWIHGHLIRIRGVLVPVGWMPRRHVPKVLFARPVYAAVIFQISV